MSPPISFRDLAFFHFLAIDEMNAYRSDILRMRDEFFASDHRRDGRSFIICLDHSDSPLQVSIIAHHDQSKHRQYNATRHYSQIFSTVVPRPLSRSAIVDVHIVVPYGEESIYISYPSDMASALFGYDAPTQLEKLPEDVRPNIMNSRGPERPIRRRRAR